MPIRRLPPGSAPAAITVETLPRRQMQRSVPEAACFVAPGVSSWREFLRAGSGGGRDWAALTRRKRVAVFIPSDVAPQEIRDCLHEEIAQALGPVNDLYHLTDSVFNDDNFHTVLTGFDMLILRAFYDPALRSGMRPEEVARALPAILARINPAGQDRPDPGPVPPTSAAWKQAIETALSRRRPGPAQLAAARRAVEIARARGWADNRLGFSLYVFGRLALGHDNRAALAAFSEAEALFRASPDTALHAAHLAVQSAAHALSSGRVEETLRIVDANAPVALAGENAELLATLLLLKAQALEVAGRDAEARIVRLDALGWARYGMGSAAEIADRLSEIAALTPRTSRRTQR